MKFQINFLSVVKKRQFEKLTVINFVQCIWNLTDGPIRHDLRFARFGGGEAAVL